MLNSLGIFHWRDGKGSRASQDFQHVIEPDPTYRLAPHSDGMVGAGIISTLGNGDKLGIPATDEPWIERMGMI